MKSLLFLTVSLCSLASAWPFARRAKMAPPKPGTQLYQLQTTSASAALTNQWVALPSGTTSYTLASAQTAASKFFVTKYDPTGTWSLHAAEDDTRQIALRGTDSVLLYAVDLTTSTNFTIPGGVLIEWGTFTMDNNVVGVNDGSALKNRTFVAVQGTGSTYNIALYDGVSNTTQSITPLTLNFVRVPT
ncbi:hypothetical protein T440DRAFT_464965 [Plenodomus tracheiphilus IPT5]|uniref:Fucose-specific lectin n=1 Tax=Plenodomus tracheiphilus IPT5 TaxID=1408161 RepID=A0A6A7BHH7_9PLEO|nr:hypothetical protein T440DRAFT_464965 [Plenodomus tracheiphilus IPT5]